jgi:hypothetical protein
MNEVSYCTIRGLHYSQLALETGDPKLRAAYEAIAADMLAKRMTADLGREVFLIDSVPMDMSSDVPHKLRLAAGAKSSYSIT